MLKDGLYEQVINNKLDTELAECANKLSTTASIDKAEAFGKVYLSDKYDCYSAGTETKPEINQDAVRIMKEHFGIDIKNQYSKLISDIPAPDIVITMGCNVHCPNIPCKERYDWGLDDPTGKSDEEFIKTANKIKEKILDLKR